MFSKIPTPTVIALMIAAIGAVCACHQDEAAQPATGLTMSLQTSPQPRTFAAMSPQPSLQEGTFVGTPPASRADEVEITPTETVGAAPN
jgi:hypothetical protein